MTELSSSGSLTINLQKSEIHHHHHHYLVAAIQPQKYQEGVYQKQDLLAGTEEETFDDAALLEAACSQMKKLNEEVTALQTRVEESLRRMEEMERK